LKGKAALIVDDYQEVRLMLRTIIEPLTLTLIKLVRNGEEAIDILEKDSFDLVLCDYNLGEGKDGTSARRGKTPRAPDAYVDIYDDYSREQFRYGYGCNRTPAERVFVETV
jgi:CheY-like chemotaxis protein